MSDPESPAEYKSMGEFAKAFGASSVNPFADRIVVVSDTPPSEARAASVPPAIPDVVEALREAVELMKDWRSAYLRLARGDSNVNELTFRITPTTNDLLDRLNAHHAPVRLSLPAAPAGLTGEAVYREWWRQTWAPSFRTPVRQWEQLTPIEQTAWNVAVMNAIAAAYAEGEPR
jgi:hypothetical protein